MKAGRLLSILLLLQTNGRMTAQRLAKELEVSVLAEDDDIPLLPQVADAVWRGRALRVRYRRWKEQTDVGRRPPAPSPTATRAPDP
ncbi:hypothetical protein ACWCXH_10300 [Kitasatospora sp. NPDC001660]